MVATARIAGAAQMGPLYSPVGADAPYTTRGFEPHKYAPSLEHLDRFRRFCSAHGHDHSREVRRN